MRAYRVLGIGFVFLMMSGVLAASEELDFADGLYSRKMYEPAISEYEKFIQKNPLSARVADARFRAAESYFFLKKYDTAEFYFDAFQKDTPSDPRQSLALFRIGAARFYQQKYSGAAHALTQASRRTKDPAIKAGVLFYLAKTQQALKNTRRGHALLQTLTQSYASSPYASYASIVMGDGLVQEKKFDSAIQAYRIASKNPDPAEMATEADFKIAEIYFELKNYEKAREFYKKTISSPHGSVWKQSVFEGLVYCDYYLKDWEAVKKRLEAEKDLFNESRFKAEMAYLAGSIYFSEKNNEKSLEYFDLALSHADSQALWADKALFKKAAILTALGRNDEVQKVYLRLSEQYPQSEFAPRALLELAQSAIDSKNFNKAVQTILDFINRYPRNEWLDVAYYKLALAKTGLGDTKGALSAFEMGLTANPFSKFYAEMLYGAATSAQKIGDAKKATGYFEHFLKVYASHVLATDVKTQLALLYFDSREFDKAAAIIQESLLKEPKIQIMPKQALWFCRFLLDQSQYALMLKALDAAAKRFPNKNLAHEIDFFTAEAQMGLKNIDDAMKFYDKSLADDPAGSFAAQAYLGLGTAWALRNDFLKAQEYFNKALAFENEPAVTARARFEMAGIRLREGQTEEAAKAFMLVAVLYDDAKYSPAALYKAGECFTAIGQTDNAQKAFAELKQRYPKNEWAMKAEGFTG